jgi:hypothetical protein
MIVPILPSRDFDPDQSIRFGGAANMSDLPPLDRTTVSVFHSAEGAVRARGPSPLEENQVIAGEAFPVRRDVPSRSPSYLVKPVSERPLLPQRSNPTSRRRRDRRWQLRRSHQIHPRAIPSMVRTCAAK